MSVSSIENLKNTITTLETSLKDLDNGLFPDQKFGNESEYTFKGMIAGVKAILVDVKSLVKNPDNFIKISTYNDRSSLNSHLSNINSYLQSPQNLWQFIDNAKATLRPLGVRISSDRMVEFESEIDKIQKIIVETENGLKSIQKTQNEIGVIFQTIKTHEEGSKSSLEDYTETTETIKKRIATLDTNLLNLETTVEKIKELFKDSNESNGDIQELLTEAKTNHKIIEGFSKKVTDLETRLASFDGKSQENEDQLAAFEAERQKFLEEAKTLISSAKQALNYKTAEGVSAAIQEQYKFESESNGGWWLAGAAACLASTIGLGVWILIDHSAGIEVIIGRVTLLPFPIIGAIFCANQYLKKQNLIQDYAYKMVLAKSLVGFSEQLLKSTEEKKGYDYFITNVLDEILQDPLRKRGASKKEKPNEKPEEDSGKISELTKLLSDTLEKAQKLIPGGK